MNGEQLSVARARAEAAEVYLRHGLVDDAKWALARLREVLGIAGEPEATAASIGGGSDEMTPTTKTRPHAKKSVAASKPRAVVGPHAGGGTSQIGSARRTRRKFTETEKKDGAQLGRELGATAAAQQLDVAVSVLRGWMKAFPAGSSFSVAS